MHYNFFLTGRFLSLILVGAGVLGACSSSDGLSDRAPAIFTTDAGGGGEGGAGGAGTTAGDGGCFLNCDTGAGGSNQLAPLQIEPKAVELTVDGGTIPTASFKVMRGNEDVTSVVIWTFERPEIGDIQGTSIFTPTGEVGGSGKLVARLAGAETSAVVTVYVKKTDIPVPLPPAVKDALDNPSGGPDPIVSLLYPYDKTVFPRGVLSPEVMWNGGSADDVYKVTLTEKHYTYTEYFTAPPPSRHIVDQKRWENFTASGVGADSDPVSFTLTRFHGGVAYSPVKATWHVAQGSLKGSVYYWELPDACGVGNGRILRIKPDSEAVDEFFQPGNCWGCHTVSRDGKTMMATYDTAFPFPMVTIDLTQVPSQPGLLKPAAGVRGTFSAFNDKGDKALISNDSASSPNVQMEIVDTSSGIRLNPDAMGNGCAEPAWSPDGKTIAGICGLSGIGWVFDSTGGDLTLADVGPDGFTTSNVRTLVPKGNLPGRPAYPSFSPGSEWIAFGRPTAGSRSTGMGDLWMVGPDGSNLVQLKAASGDNKSFNPVFAPLRAGGYFWLVFISRRDYGNRLVGTNRQQLWITAINDPPTGGDPSHPPFYMRGQEGCGKSENAYYALDPCKAKGQGCSSGVDCCEGTCIKDGNGGYFCGDPPPAGDCVADGNACLSDADCCNSPSSKCIDKFCAPPIPK